MALEGSLRDFDLFSLFNMIKIQGKSGTLVTVPNYLGATRRHPSGL